MAFLRSHVLPNELETLKELYQEATFYRLETLQRAIEEIPLDQISNIIYHKIVILIIFRSFIFKITE